MAKEIPVLVPQMVDVNVTLRCVARRTKLGRTKNVSINLIESVSANTVVQKDFHAKKRTGRTTLIVGLIEWW